MQCFTCDRQAPYYTLVSAKTDFKLIISGHTHRNIFFGEFWPVLIKLENGLRSFS